MLSDFSRYGSWEKVPEGEVFYMIIQEGCPPDWVKVGYTKNLKRRISSMQVGTPSKLRVVGVFDVLDGNCEFTNCKDLEKEAKRVLSKQIRGEWFEFNAVLLTFFMVYVSLGYIRILFFDMIFEFWSREAELSVIYHRMRRINDIVEVTGELPWGEEVDV